MKDSSVVRWAVVIAGLSSVMLWSSLGLPGIPRVFAALACVSLPLCFGALCLSSSPRPSPARLIFLALTACLWTATWIIVGRDGEGGGLTAMIFGLWLLPLLISTLGFAFAFDEFDIDDEMRARLDRLEQARKKDACDP